jgi:hypothetical protein
MMTVMKEERERQFCAGCFQTVTRYRTVFYPHDRRFHFCEKVACQQALRQDILAGARPETTS